MNTQLKYVAIFTGMLLGALVFISISNAQFGNPGADSPDMGGIATTDIDMAGFSIDNTAVFTSNASDPGDGTSGINLGGTECINWESNPSAADTTICRSDPNRLSISYGIFTPMISDTSADSGDSGFLRAGNGVSSVCHETSPASTDVCLRVDSGENVQFTSMTSFNPLDDQYISLGSGLDAGFKFATLQTPDSMMFFPGEESRSFIFIQRGDETTDFAHAIQTNPTIFMHSSTQTDPNQWGSLAHVGTAFSVGSREGPLSISPNQRTVTKGGSLDITQSQTIVTCAGGGSATLTATGVFPDGVINLGVTTRITTALTGSTGFDVGDTGAADPDIYGVQAATTLGSTTTPASATAVWPQVQLAAGDVVLTFAGGNCTAGAVAIVGSFVNLVAPTSN